MHHEDLVSDLDTFGQWLRGVRRVNEEATQKLVVLGCHFGWVFMGGIWGECSVGRVITFIMVTSKQSTLAPHTPSEAKG